ncbi:MAG: penicillin-binding protein 2, partial [Actinobacteria bacterium]|nr:penicillin-binding protein 2 [Actinomycetota bacterium]
GIRLVQIQAVEASSLSQRAMNEIMMTSTMPAPRGTITDINGVEFARSVSSVRVVVDQTLIQNPKVAARIAAPILKLPVAQIEASITGSKRWSKVADLVTPAQWRALNAAFDSYNASLTKAQNAERIFGFFSERVYSREYPSGSLIASLVGFVNHDGVGATGLEYSKNSMIAGIDGKYVYGNGYRAKIPGSTQSLVAAQQGTSIRLTIDRDVQWIASQAISKAVKDAHAISGTVIVLDPKTGAILAHATAPTFDPNNTKNVSLRQMANPSVQEVYEPGSTGKVITMSAAIEEGKVTPQTVFTVPYSLKVSNGKFSDHEKHPTERLTTTGILAVSSNTGSIQVGATLSHQTFYDYLRKFGIGSSTGSGLPGESAGQLLKVENWSGTTAPTFAFGQGYNVTAMQATSVFATIANNGIRVSPTVIAGTSDASGHFTPAKTREEVRVISADTAAKMRLMLESVVSAQGTAPGAAIPGYRVAGKTGTAQRHNDACNCYSGYTASFIGFAPADAPKYVISVTIQGPQGIHWGGSLGGPVFKEVMSFVLQTRHVAPTRTLDVPYPLNEAALNKTSAKKLGA